MAELAARPLNRVLKGWDTLRLPRLGVIQIGEKDEKGRPRSLDYFVCPPEVRAVYGDQPRRLDIAFPVADVEVIFPTQLERYGEQFGRICTGDGERANLSAVYARGEGGREYGVAPAPKGKGFVSTATGQPLPVYRGNGGKEYVQIPCQHHLCPMYRAGKCRPVGRLSFLLPRVPGILGVYQIVTSSVNSYLNVVGALNVLLGMLKVLRQPIWTVTLGLEVRMEPAHPVIGEGSNQKQVRTMVPALYIRKDDMTLEEFIRRATAGALPERGAVPLPAGVQVEIEEADEDEKPELLFSAAEVQEEDGDGGACDPAPQAAAAAPAPAAPAPAPAAAQAPPPGPSLAGEFEVVSAPGVKRDPQTGEEVVVLRVKTVSVDEDEKPLPAGEVMYAFSGRGLDVVKKPMAAARPGTRLLLEGYRGSTGLVVRQAMLAQK